MKQRRVLGGLLTSLLLLSVSCSPLLGIKDAPVAKQPTPQAVLFSIQTIPKKPNPFIRFLKKYKNRNNDRLNIN